ncbi:MAG: tryptophan-rich sensory protein [Taibaiella sp.]|nr:tryptophan-rich sensory protein [Taibaiella sp.]
MKKLLTFIGCIVLTLAVGGLSGIATVGGVKGWYTTLLKPAFNPPNYLFGPVWTLLYLLMGVSLYIILQEQATPAKKRALVIFGVQLSLNAFWSIIFFNFHEVGWALIEIISIWMSVLLMIITFYKINKTAGLLQLPYLAWVSFATILNAAIFYLN